jgi:hypothetical protein
LTARTSSEDQRGAQEHPPRLHREHIMGRWTTDHCVSAKPPLQGHQQQEETNDDGGTRRPPRIMREGAGSTPRRLRTAGHQPGALGIQLRGTGHRQEGQSGAQEETPGLRPERIGRRATDTAGSSLNIQDHSCGHGLGGRGFGQDRMTSNQAPGRKPPPCLRSRATSASAQLLPGGIR